MFGGFFFPQRGKKWQCHHSNCRANSGQQRSTSAGAEAAPAPLHPTGCAEGLEWPRLPCIPAPQPRCLGSQWVRRCEKHHGQKLPETHRMRVVLLVKDLPRPPQPLLVSPSCLPYPLAQDWELLASIHPSSCIGASRDEGIKGWRGSRDLTLLAQRASKVPQATGQECQKSSAAQARVPCVGGLHGSRATQGRLSAPWLHGGLSASYLSLFTC